MLNLKSMHYGFMLVLFSVLAACGGKPLDKEAISQLEVKNLKDVGDGVYSSGQPTQVQLDRLAKAGIKHIVNLRTADELNFDEADFSKQSGLEYHSIPIAGGTGVTHQNAKLLAAKLAELKGQPVLVHCGSGNRVGALVALETAMNGEDIDKSIELGKAWGLTTLEALVRDRLTVKR